jgi:hypothetical protein
MGVTVGISYIVKDADDTTRRMPIHYLASEVNTVAEAQGIATDFAPLYGAVSGCEIIGAEVLFPLTVPEDEDGADAGYRGDAGATLSFYNSAGVAESLFVPGWLLSKMSGKTVDSPDADDDIEAFVNAISLGSGITGGFVATDINGLKLTTYRQGAKSTRKTK